MTLKELHALLQSQFNALAVLHVTHGLPEMSTDTALSVGKALGGISQAKALVARDIDDNARTTSKAEASQQSKGFDD
jgi:hypothetical protein